MADIADNVKDFTDESLQNHRPVALYQHRSCLFCGSKSNGRAYCNTECRDEHEYIMKQRKINGNSNR